MIGHATAAGRTSGTVRRDTLDLLCAEKARWLTLAETREALQLSRKGAYALLKSGKLRPVIDTEFTDIAAPRLIDIAMVSEDGHEFYGELGAFDEESCSDFVRAHVLPQFRKYPEWTMMFDFLADAARNWMSNLAA